uniref:Claudin domain-containing 1 n=1 Tax=Xenopus tropicalis TaxID=8364 RepID=A0A803KEN5_XENTR
MDNRFATALVIGSVLSLLSVIYLSAAVGTVSWYHYFTSSAQANISYTTPEDFTSDAEKMDEKAYTDALFHFNGSLGLWQRCITVPQDHLSQQLSALTDSPTLFSCVFLSLSDQFLEKYQEPGNHNSEIDIVRTYLWRCQFLLPLVALGLIFFGALVGLAGCVCQSLYPALGTGILHLLAGMINWLQHYILHIHLIFYVLINSLRFIFFVAFVQSILSAFFFLQVYVPLVQFCASQVVYICSSKDSLSLLE